MNETQAFLDDVLPRLTKADTAFHDGDPEPRSAMWSSTDPVTLFGAAFTERGWPDIRSAFEWLTERFSDCASFEYEVLSAQASGDLAYIAGIEHTTAAFAPRGIEPSSYTLRVTTIFRREEGVWKVIHRHGDAGPNAADLPAR